MKIEQKNHGRKMILSAAVVAGVMLTCLSAGAKAITNTLAGDTTKMSKMAQTPKMAKMEKGKMKSDKMSKSKMKTKMAKNSAKM